MNTLGMAFREIRHRMLNFALGVAAVAIAAGVLVGGMMALKAYDIRTTRIVQNKEGEYRRTMAALTEEMRKATLKLGFNLLILPKEQNLSDFYADDFAGKYMPEEYVDRLAQSGTILVQHILPNLQQKLEWPEIKRAIILVGTRGEAPNIYKDPRKPLVQPVPEGTIVLGHELQQTLGVKVGAAVKLMGREFRVHACHEERGSKDDITAWVHLKAAQEILDKKGLINSILALQCLCPIEKQAQVRQEVMRILPGVQVIEMGTKIVARAESRLKAGQEAAASLKQVKDEQKQLRARKEDFISTITGLVMIACAVWVGLLALQNVNARREEIGVLRAIGMRSRQVLGLVVVKAALMALCGGLLGAGAGTLAGRKLGLSLQGAGAEDVASVPAVSPELLLIALAAALVLSVAGTWIPAVLAARKDPAAILRGKT